MQYEILASAVYVSRCQATCVNSYSMQQQNILADISDMSSHTNLAEPDCKTLSCVFCTEMHLADDDFHSFSIRNDSSLFFSGHTPYIYCCS